MRGFMRSLLTAFVLCTAGASSSALADPPARVGRISLIEGDVTFQDTATHESAPAALNWPVTGGGALATAPGARAEVRIGSTAIRLDESTALEFVRLDDETIRLRLGHGAVVVRVRSREAADGFVLETPDVRVGLSDAGRYRFEAGRAPDLSTVTVFQGSAYADAGGTAVPVRPGRRAEIGARGGVRLVAAFSDALDEWALARDRRDDAAQTSRYVSPETTGYESLDDHGDWRETPDYGPVWIPRAVPAGWAPYRTGRWAWIQPWGWTWIDEAPWGFAPFHYGRWAIVGGTWGWLPGAFAARPVYAPALVGWIGRPGWSVSVTIGSVPAVGWFPLAPREAFVPAYRCSTIYVRNVNVTHVTNVVNVFNVPPRYAHRHVERAVTVVPAAAVTGGHRVGPSALRVRHAELAAHPVATNAPPADTGRPPRQFFAHRRDDGVRPAPGAPATQPRADRPPEQRLERDRPAPPPTVVAPVQPRVAVPEPPRERPDRSGDPRPAAVAPLTPAPLPQASPQMRAQVPTQPPAPQASTPLPQAAPPMRTQVPVQPPAPQVSTPLPQTAPMRVQAPVQPPAPRASTPLPQAAPMRVQVPVQPPAPQAGAPWPQAAPPMRVQAPVHPAAQPPVPQVRAPAAPPAATSPAVQPSPRSDGHRGHPREARPGERRGG